MLNRNLREDTTMNSHFHLFLIAWIMLITPAFTAHRLQAEDETTLAAKIKRFVPTEITGDISRLSPGDRKALDKLIKAAKIIDKMYISQVWPGNEAMEQNLAKNNTPMGKLRQHYFAINMGPWSRLDHNASFIPGVSLVRPPQANYYPLDMTKEEFNTWVATLAEDEQKKATGFFYTIQRDSKHKLKTVAYSIEYKNLLEPAAQLLREAAVQTDNASLKKFLTKRADAFMSNDYYESDVAWMDLNSPLEITIGPYEVYLDELFNYKAAFEAFITLKNDEETKKLEKFSSYLQEIENNLPIEPRYRNPKLGALAPICVVDELYAGGEPKAGVQTAAFNLPNDERVTREKGSKRVMLKNVQEAKFNRILTPIARVALDPSQQSMIAFEPFFTHILAHELVHGLGPHTITVNGRQTTVRQEMKDIGSALEEAKADIAGLFALQYLIDKHIVEKSIEQQMYATFLASTFRSVRFGLSDAHGKGMALQCNYLSDEGAIEIDKNKGTYKVNFEKIKTAAAKLTGEIMTIQAEGSYDKAKALLDRYGFIRPEMQDVLNKLDDIPVDIEPRFPLAQ
jgi:hypothetical protein